MSQGDWERGVYRNPLKGIVVLVDDLLGSEEGTAVCLRQLSDVAFMHDGAPCHRNAQMIPFLAEEEIKVMLWSAQSPDLNSIEPLAYSQR